MLDPHAHPYPNLNPNPNPNAALESGHPLNRFKGSEEYAQLTVTYKNYRTLTNYVVDTKPGSLPSLSLSLSLSHTVNPNPNPNPNPNHNPNPN